MGVVAAVVSVVGGAYSIHEQGKAADEAARARQKAEDLNQKKSNVRNARARAKQVRVARAQRAAALAQSQVGGGTGGSGLTGTQASIAQGTAGNISFLNKNAEISKQLSDLNISSSKAIAKHQGRAAVGQAVGSVSGSYTDVFG